MNMKRATPQQKAYLENVYQNTDWPIKRHIIEQVVNVVYLDFTWIRKWFYRRRVKDRGITWFPPQQPPPPPPSVVVAPIMGSTGGQQSQIPEQIIIQPQQQQLNDGEPVLTLDYLLDDSMSNNFGLDGDDVLGLNALKLSLAAISELNELCSDSRLWAIENRRDVLIPSEYESRFPSPIINQFNIEASRDLRVYRMNYKELVAMLMEGNWSTLFPFMVAKEETIKVLPLFDLDNPDACLNMIYKEFRLTTPRVAKRKVNIIRAWHQVREGVLVVMEVSFEHDQVANGYESNCHRFASGCLIEDRQNGESRVIWVEHMGVSEISQGGMAFGAKVMLDLLERSCERRKFQKSICLTENQSFDEHFGEQEKQNLMHLGQAMVKDLFHTISPYEHLWSSSTEGSNAYGSLYTLAPNTKVVVGAITFKVAESPKSVLNILGDELLRHEWDYLVGLRPVQPLKHYITGNDSRNKISISLTQKDQTNVENRVLTQEGAVCKGGSLVVWSYVPRGISCYISLGQELPVETRPLLSIVSGVSISTDGHTTADNDTGGSLITLVLRELVDGNQQSQQATQSIISAVNETVVRIKAALQKQRTTIPAAVAAAGNLSN